MSEQHLFGFAPYNGQANDAYMCDTQVEHFQDILSGWKGQLIDGAAQTLSGLREREQYADEVDLAAQEESFRLELRAHDRDRHLLKKINQSLGDIKSGDYGYCEECSAEIGIKRLQARPTASMCVECKTVSELKEKQLING
jgi:DnaK suppressor protein